MQRTETSFDPSRHHIHIELVVSNNEGIEFSVDGILDTGAPKTEFSDQFLLFTGLVDTIEKNKTIGQDLETKKYSKIFLPSVKICGNIVNNFQVYISRFHETWGVDALIGLDFFRLFRVTIDYSNGILITEPFSGNSLL